MTTLQQLEIICPEFCLLEFENSVLFFLSSLSYNFYFVSLFPVESQLQFSFCLSIISRPLVVLQISTGVLSSSQVVCVWQIAALRDCVVLIICRLEDGEARRRRNKRELVHARPSNAARSARRWRSCCKMRRNKRELVNARPSNAARCC